MLQKNYFYCLLLLVILQSCSSRTNRSVYFVPEETNMLKLAKKNEVKAAVTTSKYTLEENDNSSLFNTQIAYSPIKHLGVFGNYMNWKNSYENYNFNSSGLAFPFDATTNYKLGSGAIGGYYLFQTSNYKNRADTIVSQPIGFLLDIYTGIGRGNVFNDFSNTSDTFLKFNKTYAQFGIHWQDEYVGLSFVHRIGQYSFFGGTLNGNAAEGSEVFIYLKENQKQKFRETSFKFFMGNKNIRGFLSFTTVKLDPEILRFGDNSGGFFPSYGASQVEAIFNLGLVVSINEIYSFIKNSKKPKNFQ